MNTIKEISEKLKSANYIVMYPHVNMDGDTLGSTVALCAALRSLGKRSYILIEDKIPENLKFLDKDYCVDTLQDIDVELSLCVDCGNYDRFPKREETFKQGKESMCIDHHETSNPIFDYNYIDGKAAATGEIIFKILVEMGVPITKVMGEAIFTAITTDTGNFQYSNTSKETHMITAELMDCGIDINSVSKKIYESVRKEKILINSKILANMYICYEGKLSMAVATQALIEETGALMEETEGIVDTLRSIDGVEVAAFLKETKEKAIRVSLRSKGKVDVTNVASAFNGGGHKMAAGCTLHMTLEEALETLKGMIGKEIERIK